MMTAWVLYCMVLNPTMCIRYQIVQQDDLSVASPMACMMGGAIFAAQNPTLDHDGATWQTNGRVYCQTEPVSEDAIGAWVEAQKAKAKRLEPQTK